VAQGRVEHDLASNDLRVVSQPYPIVPSQIIVAGGKASVGWGDPAINLTQPDGSKFSVGECQALLATVTANPILSDDMIVGFGAALTGAISEPRWYFSGSSTIYAGDLQFSYDGSEISLLLFNRASDRGTQYFTHESGKTWKRQNVREVAAAGTSLYPRVINYSKALTISRIALLDFSSIADADFSEVTDTKTNQASGTTFDCGADCNINSTFTYEAGKFYTQRFRMTDGNNTLFLECSGTNATLYRKVTSSTQIGQAAGVFTDTVGHEVDIVANGDSVKVFIDKVLGISVTEATFKTSTGGQILHDLVSNDIVLTTHPYPALGGNTFGATDRVVCPQDGDQIASAEDYMGIIRGNVLPTAGATQFQTDWIDANNHIYTSLPHDGAINTGKLVAGSLGALVTGGSTSDDDDITIIHEGTNIDEIVNGASQGTSSSAPDTSARLFNFFDGGVDGVADSMTAWPLYLNLPFTISS